MLGKIRNVFVFKRKAARELLEANDTAMLQKFAGLATCLGEVSSDTKAVLEEENEKIVSLIRESPRRLDYVPDTVVHQSIYKHLDEKMLPLSESLQHLDLQESENSRLEVAAKTWLRLTLLKEYLKKIESAVSSGDISRSALTEDKISALANKMLTGTGTERLNEHMRLFGDVVDQYQTQQMFYTFLDPEVATCQTGFQLLKSPALAHKLHKRKFTKFCNYYLLDKLELNTKARCVFCWADPNFSGFVALGEEVKMPLNDIIASREKYFEEAVVLGNKMMTDYTAETRLRYADRQEIRDTMRYGVYFCVGTILLDWLVCSI